MADKKEALEEKPTEELVNPGQYKQALRQARESWTNQLAGLKVDLDLALSDPDVTPEQAQTVRGTLDPQIATVTGRIREIDRRLALSDKRDKELMGVHRPELKVGKKEGEEGNE